MKQKISPKSIALVFGVLILCFVIGFYVFAWTEPSGPPPTDNVAPPITSESDPIFSGSAAATLTFASTSQWNTAYIERKQWDGGSVNLVPATGRTSLGLGSLAILGSVSGGAGGTITDGTITDVDISAFAAIAGSKISGWNATNWNTAYNWGDHAAAGYATEVWVTGQGYLTPGNETDPVWTADKPSYATQAWVTGQGYLTSYSESDPYFTGSAASGITATNISNWNTSYNWGDEVGTLTTGKWCTTDGSQVICTSDAPSTENNYVNSVSFDTGTGILTLGRLGLTSLTQDLDGRYLTSYSESDPIFSGSAAAGITATNISNWNTSYNWGDHAAAGYATEVWVTGQGYLTPGNETDPVWTADKPSYATQAWVTGQGYLTSYSESDPYFTGSAASGITATNISNWNTSYNWGDEVGTLTTGKWCTTDGSQVICTSDAPSTENNYVNSVSFDTGTGILTLGRLGLTSLTQDLDGRYLTSYSESDPIYSGSAAAGIVSGDITNWDTWTTWRDNLNRSLTGNLTLSAVGESKITVDKITVGTIDPIFNIDGEKYATYMADYAGGVRIETSGVAQLNSEGKYTIDFDNLEKGSDLWLFWQASNKDLTAVSVLLTPSFEGKTWYKKDGNILIVYGDKQGEVSHRLTALRIDYQKWGNLAEDQTFEGIDISDY